ncbi:MAG: BlaI/MecI/CopY family transcriptional regulator, partial [Lutibacter sp.]
METKIEKILDFIKTNQPISSKEIYDGLDIKIGYATVKRILSNLIQQNLVATIGQGRARKYLISTAYELLYPINLNSYFEKEIDDRKILGSYNLNLIKNTLKHAALFTAEELQKLQELQKNYEKNISNISETEYNNELERLAIDLSWKSSQIEGNTYSLLETERLLKEKETASGKSKDEAVMLLNHKDAIDFIVNDKSYVTPLT